MSAAHIEPGRGGGLCVTVPHSDDNIVLKRQDDGRFSSLEIYAKDTHMRGNLHMQGVHDIQGDLHVSGLASLMGNVGIGTATPNSALTI